jgi:hypothetical protein
LASTRTTRRHAAARQLKVALLVLLAGPGCALTARAGAVVTLPGAPLSVSIGPVGQCQSSYAGAAGDFFPADGTVGDCGFFLAFPKGGNPAAVREQTFGFVAAGGSLLGSAQYAPVSAGPVTGAGSPSDPYSQVTAFKVTDAESKLDYALITETTTYVSGDPQFRSSFDVQNVTGQIAPGLRPDPLAATLKFHAIYAGDLSTNASDFASGVFLAGPPRFVGAQNSAAGVLGGFLEAGPPSPPWSDYQAGCRDAAAQALGRCPATSGEDRGIWAAVRAAAGDARTFDDDIDPNMIDIAAGVSWDDNLSGGLAPGAHASYSIVNRAEIPEGLSVQPALQAHTVGQTATVDVTASSTAGTPYANRPLVYSIGGANPKSGSVLTDSSGIAAIRYVGTAAGSDTLQMFLDLAGSGSQTARDPATATRVSWALPPPTARAANSGFRVRAIRVRRNGAVSIVIVPLQDGAASLAVSAATAAIARAAQAGARRRCAGGRVRIGGRCRARLTLCGKAAARGRAGRALTVTVAPSSKVRKALAKGRSVPLVARLTYKSRLGGRSTARTFHVKAKGKRKRTAR